jgi:hypothetical protein
VSFEEEIQQPIDSPSEIQRYLDNNTGQVFEFQVFPNLGTFKKFESPLITNYVVTTVRLGAETIYGKIIMPKQMERMIYKLTRLEEE